MSTYLLNYCYCAIIKREAGAPIFHWAGGPAGFTGLHVASFLGLVELVAGVLERKEWDVNITDCMGSTALIWAVRKVYER